MSDRKASNKYIPPDFDPKKHKSVNGYQNSHPLRERARLLSEGILIVRFEMPYNVFCLHCESHIGQGVRFNAHKKQVDKYLSTPILEFRMKCHECSGALCMRTDPKNTDYLCVEGLRRRVAAVDVRASDLLADGLHILGDPDEKLRLAEDALYQLEHAEADKKKEVEDSEVVAQLLDLNDRTWGDPYARSVKLRRQFRADKAVDRAASERAKALADKNSLYIDLVQESDADIEHAKDVEYELEDVALTKMKQKRSLMSATLFHMDKRVDTDRNSLVQAELKRRKVLDQVSTPAASSSAVLISTTRKPTKSLSLVEYGDSD
eukprot:Partr_v1_DN24887_c0_g1_i2_m29633 putative coiled-coil domain containing 130